MKHKKQPEAAAYAINRHQKSPSRRTLLIGLQAAMKAQASSGPLFRPPLITVS
jgi:hypothetical protein